MGIHALLDAAGPRVVAQIMRDMAKDLDGSEDARKLFHEAAKLEREWAAKNPGHCVGCGAKAPLKKLRCASCRS